MLLLKTSFLTLFLVSCGFTPVYQQNENIKNNLHEISVEPSNDLQIAKLRNILSNNLNSSKAIKYVIEIVNINNYSQPIAIQKNSFITDYSIIVKVHYRLKSIDNEVIYDKIITNSSDYHATDRLFANYVAEEDSFDNNINQISDIILKDLILYFKKNFSR